MSGTPAPRYDAFLCHNGSDQPLVDQIAVRLRADAISFFLDSEEIAAGTPFRQAIETGMNASGACVVFCGREILHEWTNIEIDVALNRRTSEPSFAVIPVLLPGHAPLPPVLGRFNHVDLTDGITDAGLRRLVGGIRRNPPAKPRRDLTCGVFHPLPPAPNFVGRQEQLQRLTASWAEPGTNVTALIGLGGAGKTAIAAEFLRTILEGTLAADDVFVWSFYVDQDVNEFLKTAYRHFTDGEEPSAVGRGLLYNLVQKISTRGRVLIILDGLERVQHTRNDQHAVFGEIDDPMLKQVLARFVQGIGDAHCLITTRFPVTDVQHWKSYDPLDINELSASDGCDLLRRNGVRGTDAQLQELVDEYGTHALVIDHLGTLLTKFYDGNPQAARQLPEPRVDSMVRAERKLARVLRGYEELLAPRELALLTRFCLFRFGVTAETLHRIFSRKGDEKRVSGPLEGVTLRGVQEILDTLRGLHLVLDEGANRYTAHPAIRDHFYRLLADTAVLHRAAGAAYGEEWQLRLYEDWDRLNGYSARTSPYSVPLNELADFANTYREFLSDATLREIDDTVAQGKAISRDDLPAIRTAHANLTLQPGVRFTRSPAILDLLEEVLYQSIESGEEAAALEIYHARMGGYENFIRSLGDYARGYRVLRYFRRAALPGLDLGFYLRGLGRTREALTVFIAANEFFVGPVACLLGYLPQIVRDKIGWGASRDVAAFLCGWTKGAMPRSNADFGWGEALAPAQMHLLRGDVEAARSAAKGAERPADRARDNLALAEVHRLSRKYGAARMALDAAGEWIFSTASAEHVAQYHLLNARLLAAQDDPEHASREIQEGLSIARQSEFNLLHIDLLNERAAQALRQAREDSRRRDEFLVQVRDDATAALHGSGQPPRTLSPEVRRWSTKAFDLDAGHWHVECHGESFIAVPPSARLDQPMLGAADPVCSYVWGEAAAQLMLATAERMLHLTGARTALERALALYNHLGHPAARSASDELRAFLD